MSPSANQSQDKQQTISKPFSLSGIGLHTGKSVSLSFSPAPENSGIFFVKDQKKIPASIDQVKNTKRGTSLAGIATTEHLLAAIYGLGIDNLQIKIAGEELPALDGSALPYLEAFCANGLAKQSEDKKFLRVKKNIKIIDGDAFIVVMPYHGFKVDFMIDFRGVGKQHFVFDSSSNTFKDEIASARTFGYIEEHDALKEQGLAQGASLENALVLGKEGYINAPRFPDELVRHKILDLIGDFALLGQPLLAKVKAVKSGHKLNIGMVRRILKYG